jgi:hypothetical protein
MELLIQNQRNALDLLCEIRYAAENRHWQLFPVPVAGRSDYARTFIKNATCDIATLEQLAHNNPCSNWGLATGPASGVFAIRADDESGVTSFLSITMKYEDETDWRETLESAILGVPNCAFFAWPEGMTLRTANRRIVPGLSIRGDGDWVLIPPSTNVGGAKYNYRDLEAPLAPAPKWIIKKYFVAQDAQHVGNILPFSQSPIRKAASDVYTVGSAAGIVLPFSSVSVNAPRQNSCHCVQMLFHHAKNGRWMCRFIDEDHQTTLSRTPSFASPDKVVEASERGGALRCMRQRKALERAIEKGWGGVLLKLTEEQYTKLTTSE